jgi:hypothetical protein
MFVDVLTIVTSAAAMTAPVASVTVPEMKRRDNYAVAGMPASNRSIRVGSNRFI